MQSQSQSGNLFDATFRADWVPEANIFIYNINELKCSYSLEIVD